MSVSLRTTRMGRTGPGRATVLRRAARMLAALGEQDAELSVLLCGDDEIHALNRTYRGKDGPTDVLAFAQREAQAPPGADRRMLGDVVVSVETAARQARARGRSLLDEVTTLLAHGLLHLLGHDHRTAGEDRRMRARVDLLCRLASRRVRRGAGDAAVDGL